MTWKEENNSLNKTYSFKNFKEAIDRMQRAVEEIDKLNHHPEWTNVYNKVHVKLRTHDAGNVITSKDRKLAELLDRLFE